MLLQRKGADRYVVTHYASQVLSGPVDSADALGRELKSLFSTMGGSAKACAVGISSQADAYFASVAIPQLLLTVLTGVASGVLVPMLARLPHAPQQQRTHLIRALI